MYVKEYSASDRIVWRLKQIMDKNKNKMKETMSKEKKAYFLLFNLVLIS